jgi:hypothetical protein
VSDTRAGVPGGLFGELAAVPGAPFRDLDTESGDPLGYTSRS